MTIQLDKMQITVFKDLADNGHYFLYDDYTCYRENNDYIARQNKAFLSFDDFYHMSLFLFYGYRFGYAYRSKVYRFDLRKRNGSK